MNEPSMDKVQQLVTAVLEAVDARLDGIRQEFVQFTDDAEHRHRDLLGVVSELQRRVDAATELAELAERRAQEPVAAAPAPDLHQHVADINERMAAATKILAERMEAAQREAIATTERKIARLEDQLQALRVATATALDHAASAAPSVSSVAPATAPAAPHLAAAPSIPAAAPAPAPAPAPAMSGSFGHVTGQLPHLTDHALDEISRPLIDHTRTTGSNPAITDTERMRQVTAPPMPPIVPPQMAPNPSPAVHAVHDDIDVARLSSLITEKLDHLSLPSSGD